jgi:hypothetical protein
MPKRIKIPPVKKLLVSRTEAAQMLGGVSSLTIIRLQHAGHLTPVRLTKRPAAKVFYRIEEVLALAQASEDATGCAA